MYAYGNSQVTNIITETAPLVTGRGCLLSRLLALFVLISGGTSGRV